MAETLHNSTSLNHKLSIKTKRIDNVICETCGKGIMIPINEKVEISHCFKCNYCGESVNFDTIVDIE